MVYPHARLYICCVGGDTMKLFTIILDLVGKLFAKEKKPVSIQIQASISDVIIIYTNKD